MERNAPFWEILGNEVAMWSLRGPHCGMMQVFDRTGQKSIAVFAFQGGDSLREKLEGILRPLACKDSPLPVKIVTDASLTMQLRGQLPALGFHILRLVERAGNFEMRYHPESSKFQVSLQEPGHAPASKGKIRVLIIDDSPLICTLLTKVLASDPELEVVASIGHPMNVEAAIVQHQPDVITLDLHLPEMNGVEVLTRYIPRHNIPTVILSSITPEEGPLVLAGLEAGAVDYIQKPAASEMEKASPLIIDKLKAAALVTPRSTHLIGITKAKLPANRELNQERVIVIGASTGGTKALREIFLRMPREIPPIVVVQHIPAGFSAAFADRLNQICEFRVKEAEDGEAISPGKVLIAPGGKHLKMAKGDSGLVARVGEGLQTVNGHMPSVDVLFQSVVENCGEEAVGVLLTGMGSDGANGLMAMKEKGCFTVVQDEASCVVFGMPNAALQKDPSHKVVPLLEVAQALVDEISIGSKLRKQAG